MELVTSSSSCLKPVRKTGTEPQIQKSLEWYKHIWSNTCNKKWIKKIHFISIFHTHTNTCSPCLYVTMCQLTCILLTTCNSWSLFVISPPPPPPHSPFLTLLAFVPQSQHSALNLAQVNPTLEHMWLGFHMCPPPDSTYQSPYKYGFICVHCTSTLYLYTNTLWQSSKVKNDIR